MQLNVPPSGHFVKLYLFREVSLGVALIWRNALITQTYTWNICHLMLGLVTFLRCILPA